MIKYHDNNIEPQYGADGKLLDNWNANNEYADNEYCHVFFRIETPSYFNGNHVGFDDEDDRKAFYDEVYEVFNSLGWEHSLTDLFKEKCNLYIHPQEISGDVRKADVKTIAEALDNNKLFYIRWVDIYADVFDITPEEQIKNLETHKDEIRNMLLEKCKTSRRNKYCYASEAFAKIGRKFEIDEIGKHYRSYYCYGETLEYVAKVADELVTEGYMDKWSDDRCLYIRTLNKTELKAKGLCHWGTW